MRALCCLPLIRVAHLEKVDFFGGVAELGTVHGISRREQGGVGADDRRGRSWGVQGLPESGRVCADKILKNGGTIGRQERFGSVCFDLVACRS